MSDIASLGVKVESNLKTLNKDMEKTISLSEKVTDATKKMESQMAGVSSTTKNVITEEVKRQKSIDKIILSLSDQEKKLALSKNELNKYNLALLGASNAEKQHAEAMMKNIKVMQDEILSQKAAAKAAQDHKKAMQDANTAVKSHDNVLGSLITRLSALGAAYFGIQAIKNFASSLIDTAKIADNYKYSLQAVSDSNEQAGETFNYLVSESKRLGTSVTGQVDAFTGFAASAKAAGLTVEETRSAYTGLNEAMTALHRSPEQAGAALNALQQMLATGTVRAQELNIQLANAIPGAVPLFAKALDKDVGELKKLMKDGLIPAKEAVILFTDYLSNNFQNKVESASNSVTANITKMNNAWFFFKKAIIDSAGSNTTNIIKDLTNEIESLTSSLSTPEGQKALKDTADGLYAIGKAALWAMDSLTSFFKILSDVRKESKQKMDTGGANPFSQFIEGIQKAKEGELYFLDFFKASIGDRSRMLKDIDSAHKTQSENSIKYLQNQEQSWNALWVESLLSANGIMDGVKRISDAEIKRKQEAFKAKGMTIEQGEELEKLIDKIKEQAEVAGKTDIQIMEGNLRKLTSDEALIKSQLDLMKTTEAKNKAVKDADKAAREAESERERAAEKAIADEKARQGRVDAIINKMKEQIATYKQATEVSAEYQLVNEKASPDEIKLAKDLANTIDALKAKTKAQEAYKKVMDKTAPDPIEMNRQKSIEAVNQAVKDGAVLNGTYAESLAQINKHFDDLDLKDFKSGLKELETEINSMKTASFGNEMADGINNAVISMRDLNDYLSKQTHIQAELNKKKEEANKLSNDEERKKALKEIDNLEDKNISNQLTGYRELFGTTSQLFKENSREREVMHNIEMAFAAAEIAMNLEKTISAAYLAIAESGTLPPPASFAAIAAMTALMAGIVAAAGGSLSGGGSASAPSVSASSTQGTGTVMGNPSEKSQSANNALEFMKDIEAKQYNELRDINKGVVDLNNNITNLVTSIVRTGAGTGNMGLAVGTSKTEGSLYNRSVLTGGLTLVTDEINKATNDIDTATKNFGAALAPFTLGASLLVSEMVSNIATTLIGGSKKTSITAQGLKVSTGTIEEMLDGAGISVQKFADVLTTKKSGWLTGGGTKKYLNEVLAELTPDEESVRIMFTNVFKNMGETMVAISKELNMGDDNLKEIYKYVFEFGDMGKLDLKGMDSEALTAAISSAISKSGDAAVTALFGTLIDKYVQVGSTLLETAIRVVSERAVVLDILEMTGQGFKDSGIPAYSLEITQSLISVAGGIKELQDASATYYDKFFSDSEKQIRLQGQLSETMVSMGQSMPDTREGLRKIVESLDLTTEAGQRGYITLLELSESFDTVYSKIEADNEKKLELELQIMNLTGKGAEALAIQRQKEIDSLSEANKPLQERIYALQDEAEALKKTQERETKLTTERQKIQSTAEARYNLELQIMKLTGHEAEALAISRKKELASMNESLRPLQEKVWELEDLKNVVNVDYKAIAEAQKQNIKNIVEDGVKTFNYLMKSAESYGGLVVNLDDKSKDLIQSLNDFQHAISATLDAASMYKDAILESIKAIQPEKIFESIFETTNTSNILDPINKFVLDIKDRISIFGEVIDEAGKGVNDYLSSVGDINKQYMQAQDALNKSVYLSAEEQSKVADTFKYTVQALAQTSSEIEEVRSSFASKLNMKNVLSDTLSVFEETIIKKAGENISPVIELNISKDIFAGLVSSGAIDKVAASIAGITEGSASEFQSAYSQLIKLLTQGTITTEEFNSVFNVTKDIFTGVIKPIQTVTEDLEKRFTLEMEILRLTGKETEAIKLEREKELATLGDTLKPLQERVWLLQDEKTASELAAKTAADLLESQKQAEEEKKKLLEDNLSLAEEALKKSTEKQIDFYKTLADEANRIFEESRTMLDRSFAAEQTSITKQHEMLISGLTSRLEEAQSAASDLESVFNSLSDARKSMELDSGGITYKAVQKQLSDAITMAKTGDISGAKELVPNLGILTSQGAEKYGSQEEFKRDFFKTYNALSELEGLTGTQLTEQQQMVKALETQIEQANINNQNTLNSLQAQYDAVTGVNKSVISFQDAIVQFQKAQYEADGANTLLKTQTEVLNNQLNVLLGIDTSILSLSAAINALVAAQAALVTFNQPTIPAFANGGYHSGGLRLVGENGPEMEYTPPAQITSNNDLKSMMSNEEVVAELRSLRAELARANFELVKNSGESKKTLREWQEIGILTRTA